MSQSEQNHLLKFEFYCNSTDVDRMKHYHLRILQWLSVGIKVPNRVYNKYFSFYASPLMGPSPLISEALVELKAQILTYAVGNPSYDFEFTGKVRSTHPFTEEEMEHNVLFNFNGYIDHLFNLLDVLGEGYTSKEFLIQLCVKTMEEYLGSHAYVEITTYKMFVIAGMITMHFGFLHTPDEFKESSYVGGYTKYLYESAKYFANKNISKRK